MWCMGLESENVNEGFAAFIFLLQLYGQLNVFPILFLMIFVSVKLQCSQCCSV